VHVNCARRHGYRLQPLPDPQGLQCAHGVWPELQTGAHLIDACCLLVHADLMAGARKGDGGCQTCDACSCDANAQYSLLFGNLADLALAVEKWRV
jgi:hypothetical protein